MQKVQLQPVLGEQFILVQAVLGSRVCVFALQLVPPESRHYSRWALKLMAAATLQCLLPCPSNWNAE